MTRLLFVTDLYYPAKGRRYYDEDVFLTGELRQHFPLIICHPRDLAEYADSADIIVLRNTGPIAHFEADYRAFRRRAAQDNIVTYNSLDGMGDQMGKPYLLDMARQGLPVIPTVDTLADVHLLPPAERYVVKPKDGSDSIGLKFLTPEQLPRELAEGDTSQLIQPAIDFSYEVSFYFLDGDFQYALNAPDTSRRWALQWYEPTAADLDFARRFVAWNAMSHGIQRVDACRAPDGSLLLVELEDFNPYLSLLDLPEAPRQRFVTAMLVALDRLA